MNKPNWKNHLARFTAGAILVLLLGMWSGQLLAFVGVFLLMYLAWQFYNSLNLYRWLQAADKEPPESLGMWAEIFDRIATLQKQNMKRKSYQLKAGSVKNIQLVESELSDPSAGEITIQVKSIGFNFADIFAIWGLYGATPEGVFIPGLEYAGIVVKVGAGVTNVKVGDKIMGVTRFGAYTTHLNIDSRYVIPLPEDWIFEEGELEFLPKSVVTEFLKNRFNKSLESIGIDSVFEINETLLNETEWFDDEIIGTKHGDFFVKRSINYSKRTQSITSDDLF